MENNVWKIAGTAVQGCRHIANNTPCQDKIFSLRDNERETSVIRTAIMNCLEDSLETLRVLQER